MLPRWFERPAVLVLLLIGLYFRLTNLAELPLGFSDAELQHIEITEQTRSGMIRVFFAWSGAGGQESMAHLLNNVATRLWGDGLLGYRLLSVWASLLTLALLYRVARSILGKGIALVALGIMVTAIWPILLGRGVGADSLASLLVLLVLAFIIWIFRLNEPIAPYPPRTLPYTLLGFLLGLAIYVHYIGVFLALVLAAFILYLWLTRQPISRQLWPSHFFTLNLTLILALPYMISVIRNPHSTSWGRLWERHPTGVIDFMRAAFKTLLALGLSGDQDPTHNLPGLPLMSPFWFVMACVGFYFALRRWREPAYGLLLITLGMGALPAFWVRDGADFSTMLMFQPILFILAGLGTFYAAQYLHNSNIIGGWPLVALIAALVFFWTGTQAFDGLLQQWGQRADVQLAYHSDVARLAVYLDRSSDQRPVLLCVSSLAERPTAPTTFRLGEAAMAEKMLSREDINRRYAICRSGFVFVQGGETMRVLLSNPLSLGETSAAIQPWFAALSPLPQSGLPLGVAYLLDAREDLASLGGQLQAQSALLYPAAGSPTEMVTLPVRFGRNITLLGAFNLQEQPYNAGDVLAISSYWRIDGAIPSRLGIFTRLHDRPQASPYTETNVLDIDPQYLQERDILLQVSFMTIPTTLLPGDYLLTLGAYDNNPLNQLPVFDTLTLTERGNYLIFGQRITVSR